MAWNYTPVLLVDDTPTSVTGVTSQTLASISQSAAGGVVAPDQHSTSLPSGAVVSLQGAAPSFSVEAPSGFVDLFSLLQGGIAVPVTPVEPPPPPEPGPAGAFHPTYDAILWPPQWSTPRISVSLMAPGAINIQGFAPGFRLSSNYRSKLPCERFEIRANSDGFRAELTGNIRTSIPSANFSTRGRAPAILVSEDGISEVEALCLMLM